MKCSYHPNVDAQEFCSTCNKALCSQCAHKIKGSPYCETCLVEGAEMAATAKGLRLRADSPRRAAWVSLIPGMGAVYNNDYIKAITFFAVFAGLVTMGDRVHGVFGFGAVAFLIFTMFDSYRAAEANNGARLRSGVELPARRTGDKANAGWGIFLIVLGFLFLLQNVIPFYFLNRLWPLVFVLLGGYLVYRALNERAGLARGTGERTEQKEV